MDILIEYEAELKFRNYEIFESKKMDLSFPNGSIGNLKDVMDSRPPRAGKLPWDDKEMDSRFRGNDKESGSVIPEWFYRESKKMQLRFYKKGIKWWPAAGIYNFFFK